MIDTFHEFKGFRGQEVFSEYGERRTELHPTFIDQCPAGHNSGPLDGETADGLAASDVGCTDPEDVKVLLFSCFQYLSKAVFLYPVVRIYEPDIAPAGIPQTQVPGCGKAGMSLAKNSDARM